MKTFLKENSIFLALYGVFAVIGAAIILCFERGNETLYFSSIHTPFFNQFFVWVTRIAEWPLFALTLVIIIRFSYAKGLAIAINLMLVFLVVQLLKIYVFGDQVRPSVYFEGKAQLNFVQGLEILRTHSFPSGHTAGAFAFFFMLSLLNENKRWSVLLFLIPLLVGVSRVYLLQHFFRDVYAGSLIAVVISSIFYLTFVRSNFYQNLTWKDKALMK